MLSYNEAFYILKKQLTPLYDQHEAAAITHELLLHITGDDKLQRLVLKEKQFTTDQQIFFEHAQRELLTGRPIQYVTGTAWFKGKKYFVTDQVLIPRPETEELVNWIIEYHYQDKPHFSILEVGTGSGCISISLQLALPKSTITACDISKGALEIANENAKNMDVSINFLQFDFLNSTEQNKLGMFDVIVSNPPYIPMAEKEKLHQNVSNYEPGIALFVPDADPLLFYKAIAAFGKSHLTKNGYIYCELDAGHAFACEQMFASENYQNVELRKDMFGNFRMLKATLI